MLQETYDTYPNIRDRQLDLPYKTGEVANYRFGKEIHKNKSGNFCSPGIKETIKDY